MEQVPLTLANFADGALEVEVNAKIADVLERFRRMEDGEIELASDKASITIKLHIERSPAIGGFITSVLIATNWCNRPDQSLSVSRAIGRWIVAKLDALHDRVRQREDAL